MFPLPFPSDWWGSGVHYCLSGDVGCVIGYASMCIHRNPLNFGDNHPLTNCLDSFRGPSCLLIRARKRSRSSRSRQGLTTAAQGSYCLILFECFFGKMCEFTKHKSRKIRIELIEPAKNRLHWLKGEIRRTHAVLDQTDHILILGDVVNSWRDPVETRAALRGLSTRCSTPLTSSPSPARCRDPKWSDWIPMFDAEKSPLMLKNPNWCWKITWIPNLADEDFICFILFHVFSPAFFHQSAPMFPATSPSASQMQVMEPQAWGYYSSGGDDEITLRDNHMVGSQNFWVLVLVFVGETGGKYNGDDHVFRERYDEYSRWM